jgi:large subunit ribosomal protein L22
MMEGKASLSYIRMAPRKLRVILDAIREKPVEIALAQLTHSDRRAAGVVHKLLASAVANVGQGADVDTADLYVSAAWADQGPTLRRFRPRAMGRASRINKRTSHVTVVVSGLE